MQSRHCPHCQILYVNHRDVNASCRLQHSMRTRVYNAMVVSVRLSGPVWAHHNSKPAAIGLLLLARRAGDIDRLLHGWRSAAAAGECGQCHVISVQYTHEAEHRLVQRIFDSAAPRHRQLVTIDVCRIGYQECCVSQ